VRRPRVACVTTVDLTLRTVLFGQLRYLRDAGFDVTTISAPGPGVASIRSAGFAHLQWPSAPRSWNPLADVRAFRELIGILRRGRFDLVHTHTPKAGFLGRLAARAARVPCVVNTVHGFYATPEDPASKRVPVLALEWLAARASDWELFVSEEDLRWARRIGLTSASRSSFIGNGVDLDRFRPQAVPPDRVARLRSELGISGDALVVGTVGRLVAEKGVRDFAEAARRVRRRVPRAVFVAVGAPDHGKAGSISDEEVERLRPDVVFTGWRDDVRDLLAAMDVFVLASWREGLPVSALHAAAMGLPLVLTDIRGCREVVRHGIDGRLVPARAPARLAEAIERLLQDEGLRRRLGASARERCVERFDERRVGDRLVETYRDLLRPKLSIDVEPRPVRLRRARPSDAAAIARLHREGLADSFLPLLGDPFLRQLYRALAVDRDALSLVAENGAGVVGFATGVLSVKGFYRRFALRRGLPAAVAAAPALARAGVRRRLRETVRYPEQASDLPDAELLAIAVAPGLRSRGVGRALALGVVRGLAARGADQVKVVAAQDNGAATSFYSRLGFTHRRPISVHAGRSSHVWVIDAGRQQPSSGERVGWNS
jgi:glycosyltransferase involved in cell wall biosynthesis/ribosomal protein S18 acetylase RimI-like enzyme